MAESFFELSPSSEPWRSASEFYLRDPGDEAMAYSFDSTVGNKDEAQATIAMSDGELRFAPIDHNLEYDSLASGCERHCDGMLYSRSRKTIVFVELKDRKDSSKNRKKWRDDAIEQLRATVKLFKKVEMAIDTLVGGRHLAVAANKRSRYAVEYARASRVQRFLLDEETSGFRLSICNKVVLGSVV